MDAARSAVEPVRYEMPARFEPQISPTGTTASQEPHAPRGSLALDEHKRPAVGNVVDRVRGLHKRVGVSGGRPQCAEHAGDCQDSGASPRPDRHARPMPGAAGLLDAAYAEARTLAPQCRLDARRACALGRRRRDRVARRRADRPRARRRQANAARRNPDSGCPAGRHARVGRTPARCDRGRPAATPSSRGSQAPDLRKLVGGPRRGLRTPNRYPCGGDRTRSW
jgi:hypothetical protein